jgi:hypothetical protein
MATVSAHQLRRISLQTQAQVVVVNVVFLVLPRGNMKKMLTEKFATLTLTMGQEGDIVMLGSSMVPYITWKNLN